MSDVPMPDSPDLSIVVTIVEGGEKLALCLDALTAQMTEASLEVIVTYDHISRDAEELSRRFPSVRFADIGAVLDGVEPRNAMELHRFFDIRRAEALKLARGRLIGILEDRGIPAPDWAAAMIRLHQSYRDGVIGGAARNGVDRLRNWAVFFCDFGRYQPPLDEVEPEYVTDTNIAYKRESLWSVRHLWEVRYQEPEVNWALRRAGHGLRLSDAPMIEQVRETGSLPAMGAERFHWARLYGEMRAREASGPDRLKHLALAPALPFALLLRHLRRQIEKGHHLQKFLLASPITLYLLMCWAAGEFAGTLDALKRGGRH